MGIPFAKAIRMNRLRSISGLVCVAMIFICATRAVAQDDVDANRQRAEALWEEAIRAKGGRERLHSIESFVISSTIDAHLITPAFGSNAKSGHVDSQTERLYAMPTKAWLYEFTPSFDVKLEATVINIERNLCMVTLAPVGPGRSVPGLSLCVPTIWPKRLIQDPVLYLMETRWVRPQPLRTRTDGKGKKQQDVIETEVGQLRLDFYLDRKTHLPVKVVTENENGDPRMPRMDLMVTFEDYVEVDGIQMPRRVIRQPLLTRVERRDTERARYRFNVAYDEEIFNFPIPKNAKSKDWEKKN
jgi:hypothetical protein